MQELTFKAMYIHGNDLAMRLTLKAISKGNHEAYHIIADIGRAELIQDMGGNAKLKQIPTWLLPSSCLVVAGIDSTDRHKIRQDIMLMEMTHLELMRYNTEGMEHPEDWLPSVAVDREGLETGIRTRSSRYTI